MFNKFFSLKTSKVVPHHDLTNLPEPSFNNTKPKDPLWEDHQAKIDMLHAAREERCTATFDRVLENRMQHIQQRAEEHIQNTAKNLLPEITQELDWKSNQAQDGAVGVGQALWKTVQIPKNEVVVKQQTGVVKGKDEEDEEEEQKKRIKEKEKGNEKEKRGPSNFIKSWFGCKRKR